MLAVLSALAASLMYAFAAVFQQRGAAAQEAGQSMKLTLLTRLIQNPLWLLGLVADVFGYVFQFVALGHGTLVLVQPLLVCGLLFALPVGAAWAGRRLHRIDWVGALMVCAGLAVFLTIADPRRGRDNVRPYVWVLLLASDTALAVVLIAFGRTATPRRKAVLYSAAAGVVYGAAAALTKTSSHLLDRGIWRVVDHWQPYILVVAAVAGMVMAQSAFQAGALDVSLPTMSVTDPVVSIMIGALAFREGISSSVPAVAVEVVSLLVMSSGIFLLARAELAEPVAKPPAASP